MALITFSMGISMFYWYTDENYSLFYKLDIIETFTTLSFVPVLFLYFKEITGSPNGSALKTWLLFSPTLLFGAGNLFAYLYMGDEQATACTKYMLENGGNVELESKLLQYLHLVINGYTYSLILVIQTVAVCIYAIYHLLLYRKHLNDFFSNVEDMGLEHYWSIFWGVMAFLVLTFISSGTGYILYIEYDVVVSIIRILFALILYYTCYHVSCAYYTVGKIIPEITFSDHTINEENSKTEESPKESERENKKQILSKLLPKFNQVIDEEKVFLQKNLRVDDVAALVGTNRTYISRILKEEYNYSFWEFINRKRIEYAKELATQSTNLTIEELADRCGFSHGSAFSRAFRQCEGITFKDWHTASK